MIYLLSVLVRAGRALVKLLAVGAIEHRRSRSTAGYWRLWGGG